MLLIEALVIVWHLLGHPRALADAAVPQGTLALSGTGMSFLAGSYISARARSILSS
jgi:hypothetical protein